MQMPVWCRQPGRLSVERHQLYVESGSHRHAVHGIYGGWTQRIGTGKYVKHHLCDRDRVARVTQQ